MNPTSASRLHRIVTTPMSDLLVGRVTGRPIKLDRLIEQADLPEVADALVRDVVKRTRLWRNEKIAVATELIAHFRDGLDAGREADDLVETFGDPATAAKLIRRAKKRNRSFIWHGLKWCRRVVLGVFAIYFLAWAWLMTGSPNPSVDYLAQMNAPALAVPEDDRAWPLYRELLIEHELMTRFNSEEVGSAGWGMARPGEPAWPELVNWLAEHESLIPALREAAAKPGLGLEVGFADAYTERDWLALNGPDKAVPVRNAMSGNAADRLAAESIIGVLLPQLSPMRTMARVVAGDMRLAATQNDGERVVANFRSLLGIAQQSRETPTLINQLVAYSIVTMAMRDLADILDQHADTLSDAQWTELAHEVAAAKTTLALDFSGERKWFLDTVQRIYSDDGNGGGQVTFDGLQFMAQLQSAGSGNRVVIDPAMAVGLPAAAAIMASRADILAEHDRLMNLLDLDTQRPLWEVLRQPSEVNLQLRAWHGSYRDKLRYAPLVTLMPAFDAPHRKSKQVQAGADALAVAIALELYRRKHGGYPQDLATLVPRYVPTLPIDASTGQPLLYRLVDGRPLLYGRGLDGDDDGGLVSEQAIDLWPHMPGWPESPEDDDWVLFPPPSTQSE